MATFYEVGGAAASFSKNATLIVGVPLTAIAIFDLYNLKSDLKKWEADCKRTQDPFFGPLLGAVTYKLKESIESDRRVKTVARSFLFTIGCHYIFSSIERGLKC